MTPPKLLIIDPHPNLVEFYQTWLESTGFELEFRHDGHEFLTEVDPLLYDLVLLDLGLPEVDSLEILQHFMAANPNLSVILAYEAETIRTVQLTEALKLGLTTFVEKPYQAERLLETVWRAGEQHPPGLACGNLLDLSLPNLISLLCHEGKTAALELKHLGQVATIFFEKGELVHAAFKEAVGQEVVFEVLTWDEGSFTIITGRPAPIRTIETSWTGLLLEGLGRLDETVFDQEQENSALPAQAGLWSQMNEHDLPVSPPFLSFDLDDETQLQIKDRLGQLHQALAARCTLFTSRGGRLLHVQGQVEETRMLALAALIASSYSAQGEVAKLLAAETEETHFSHNLQEGPHFSLYTTQVGAQWILAVAFDPEVTNLGLARQLTLQAGVDLEQFLSLTQFTDEQRQAALSDMEQMLDQDVIEDLFAQVWKE